MAVSAVALPLLILGIDLVGERPGTAATAQEVILRESFLFPILLFGLFLAGRIGFDALWFAVPSVVVVDLIMVVVLVGLTSMAFARSLRLILFRSELQEAAFDYIRQRMRRVVRLSLVRRIANSILRSELAAINVGLQPFNVPRRNKQDILLEVPGRGRLNDLNLDGLLDFFRSLPTANESLVGSSDSPSPPLAGGSATERAWLMKIIGDEVTDKSAALIRLDREIFASLDLHSLERRLQRLVEIK